MNPEQIELLLTMPASQLTRKQRKERAAAKRLMARRLNILPGYMLGRVRAIEPPQMPAGLRPMPGVQVMIENRDIVESHRA